MHNVQADERLSQLAAQNRTLRVLAGGLLALLALQGLTRGVRAAVEPTELAARRFVLTDAHGQQRAMLALDSRGTPRLTFFGPNGSETYSISGEAGLLPVRYLSRGEGP
jgi:hypothetical protein